MNHHLSAFLLFLLLSSCTQQGSQERETENPIDSSRIQPELPIEQARLPEPLVLSLLYTTDRLDNTSGGLPNEDKATYCDSSEHGFYGRYNLIDRRIRNRVPVIGLIDVHNPGTMANWKVTDTTQRVWKISLTSDILSLWDSLHVGLRRDDVAQFNQLHQGECVEIDDQNYECVFQNFLIDYTFSDDTLAKLTVRRACE